MNEKQFNINSIFDFKPLVEERIEQLAILYQKNKGLILTESDLKFHILLKLYKIREFSLLQKTKDENTTIPLHSELTWYDKFQKLSITPDISIIEPSYLNILRMQDRGLKLPSKGYSFNGKAIILELKFIKYSGGITKSILNNQIIKDYKKIQELKNKLDHQGTDENIYCYFVIFNKTNKKCQEFDKFLIDHKNSDFYKIIYKTGNVGS